MHCEGIMEIVLLILEQVAQRLTTTVFDSLQYSGKYVYRSA
jgi:hypothetical protein